MLAGCYFDPRKADHFFDYVERFATLTEGAFNKQPFVLQPWQRETAGQFFGWMTNSPEWKKPVRRFRYWYLEIPKKNGKTPFAATVGLYLLTADSVDRQSNVHVAATTKKQAEKLIVHAARQLPNRLALKRHVKKRKVDGYHELHFKNNVWTCLTASPDSNDGINGHVIADELHRWKGFEFWNVLRWSIASHPEGVFFAITTAGNSNLSLCRTLHDKTQAINAGRHNEQDFLGQIFAASDKDDPHKKTTWLKANPSLGSDESNPLKLSTFTADYKAAAADPAQWPAWLQLRLNIWRSAEAAWFPIDLFDAGETERKRTRKRIDCFEPFTGDDLAGQTCTVALDGATIRDTTAAAFTFYDEQNDIYRPLVYYWLPRKRAEELGARVPFQIWHERGFIKLTDGDAVDFETVFQDLTGLVEKFKPECFYFDPYFQAEYLTQKIENDTGVERIEFPQTIMHYSAVTKAAERLIHQKRVRHNGNPIFTWQLSHTKIKTDANQNQRPVKHKHGDIRTIDGVVAWLMSLKYWQTEKPRSSFYDDNELEMG